MKSQKIRKAIGVIAVALCVYSYFCYTRYENRRTGVIYSPSDGSIYMASLSCNYPRNVWSLLNPFEEPIFNNIHSITYLGSLAEMRENKKIYDRLREDDLNAAINYLMHNQKYYRFDKDDKLRIDFNRLYPFVKSRPLHNVNGKDLLPIDWQWITLRDITVSDLKAIDIAVLGGSVKFLIEQSRVATSKGSENILYLPKCLLICGEAALLLQNEGHFFILSDKLW